ncbi:MULTISPECIES: ABC transporter permease [unclassified Spirosoma]|uniref:ABC transporter permease n=1 Tax=unclassified Spirosoma TaxID=2621999 RepID=UPI000A8E70AC|nr:MULTISPECIES: ABC transporter permease [unclassified Spirosoma]MBN8820982.1 ABC transporter permease [Spirosoma sp.]
MSPPRLADRLLTWFCAPHLREEVLGDLHERYAIRVKRVGATRARRRYWRDVMTYMRPEFLKRQPQNFSNPKTTDMLRNYITVAWRNLMTNKSFTAINMLGLAIGLTSFMLIAVYVYNELSYDKYPTHANQIYRIHLSVTGNGDVAVYPNVDVAVGEGMQKAFPEVIASTRLGPAIDYVQYKDNQFKETHLAFADSNFLQLFSIPFIKGNPATALVAPNSIVVSEEFAKKYFGNEDPMGKSLAVGTQRSAFTVTGIIDKIPDNSHFHADAFLSLSTHHITNPTWSNLGFFTYLELSEKGDPKKLEAKFPQLVAKYVVPEVQRDMGISLAEARKSIDTFRFSLQPLTDIHLYSNTKYEMEPNGDIKYVYIFSALALFILLLACINFTNLSTAQAAKRSREVGIRKVMGSVKNQLVFQFLTESVLLTLLAMVVAYGLLFLLLPYFNQVADKQLSFFYFLDYRTILTLFGVSILSGIIAGVYPAFFLSSFSIIKTLKGAFFGKGSQKKSLHSGLIVFQFAISTILLIATLVVYRQLQYMQNKKLGYDKDQVIALPDTRLLGDQQLAFKEQLAQNSHVVAASLSRYTPGGIMMDGTQIYPKNETSNGAEIHANIFHVDYDYLRTLGIQVLQGRNFSRDFPTDSISGILINESAVRELGWKNTNPVGKSVVRSGNHEFKVIGVVKDFNYVSVKQKVAPLMLMMGRNSGGIVVKIKTTDVSGFLDDLKKQWTAFNANGPLEYHFLDDQFATFYASEQRTQQLFTAFAVLAVIIASLGLFALSAFVIEQRTKEIGIRKVMGSSIPGIVQLLVKDFIQLVVIAVVIASPIAWYAMNHWLEDFAYRIDVEWWMFALSGLMALSIALLTVSYQSIKAALMNPVKSLRSE